jgi:hypothetical protein
MKANLGCNGPCHDDRNPCIPTRPDGYRDKTNAIPADAAAASRRDVVRRIALSPLPASRSRNGCNRKRPVP